MTDLKKLAEEIIGLISNVGQRPDIKKTQELQKQMIVNLCERVQKETLEANSVAIEWPSKEECGPLGSGQHWLYEWLRDKVKLRIAPKEHVSDNQLLAAEGRDIR